MNRDEIVRRLPGPLPSEHCRHLLKEALIGVVITIAFNAPIVFLVFASQENIERWGPQCSLSVFCRKPLWPHFLRHWLCDSDSPPGSHGEDRFLQCFIFALSATSCSNLARSVVIAALATCVLAGTAIGVTLLLWQGPLSFAKVLPLKLAYAGVIGLVVPPVVILAALGDEPHIN